MPPSFGRCAAHFIWLVAFVLCGCGHPQAHTPFPAEDVWKAEIRVGMPVADVTARFGEPTATTEAGSDGIAVLLYVAPIEQLVSREEGYKGFRLFVRDGKVIDGAAVTGTPSLPPSHR